MNSEIAPGLLALGSLRVSDQRLSVSSNWGLATASHFHARSSEYNGLAA